jgi:hypothetical protein
VSDSRRGGATLCGVMAGQQPVEDGRERPYVPAIHVLLLKRRKKGVDARDKRGHDEGA